MWCDCRLEDSFDVASVRRKILLATFDAGRSLWALLPHTHILKGEPGTTQSFILLRESVDFLIRDRGIRIVLLSRLKLPRLLLH